MAAAAPATSRAQVLGLYRALLRHGSKFRDYNFREYALRRTKERFRASRDEADPAKVAALYEQGLRDLEVVARQAQLSQMYFQGGFIVESRKKPHFGEQASGPAASGSSGGGDRSGGGRSGGGNGGGSRPAGKAPT